MTREELKEKIDEIDIERNGKVSFSEVSAFWVKIKFKNIFAFSEVRDQESNIINALEKFANRPQNCVHLENFDHFNAFKCFD